jgi:multidrug efflux pump subunit AcrB
MQTLSGKGVPLDELGEWHLVPTVSAIDRRQGERVSTVQGFLMPFALPAPALAEFRSRIEQAGFALPAGYRMQIGGEAEQSAESMGNLLSMFVFFALAMAVVVILSLNSFRQAALIGCVGLLSFGLALFGVRLFGYPFGYMALIGSLGMMGLAINGAIVVLSALKAHPQALAGNLDAAADVVVDATRHIVSTTVTTIGGFVPLIIAGGTFWPPLATAIAGGVGGSAVIALYMVPAVAVAMERRRRQSAEPDAEVLPWIAPHQRHPPSAA